jgi:hypothetical protein
MAKPAGSRVRDRHAGWDRAPFTSGSYSQAAAFGELPSPPALRSSYSEWLRPAPDQMNSAHVSVTRADDIGWLITLCNLQGGAARRKSTPLGASVKAR